MPQGSVLGARMCTMYMRPLSAIMNKHGVSYHSYADDIQLYLKCGNNDISVDGTISRLEMCIRDICKWMSQNALKLNEDKTDFIIFSPKQNQFTTKVINVGANKIPSSTSKFWASLWTEFCQWRRIFQIHVEQPTCKYAKLIASVTI